MAAGGRVGQDAAVDRLIDGFADYAKSPATKDRRDAPSHGYRAVHVIVYPDGLPVEVQVRTELQDAWAQAAETLGDRWGRGLRYGSPPDEPERRVVVRPATSDLAAGDDLTRRQAVMLLIATSDAIAQYEDARRTHASLESRVAHFDGGEATALREELRVLSQEFAPTAERLRDIMAFFDVVE